MNTLIQAITSNGGIWTEGVSAIRHSMMSDSVHRRTHIVRVFFPALEEYLDFTDEQNEQIRKPLHEAVKQALQSDSQVVNSISMNDTEVYVYWELTEAEKTAAKNAEAERVANLSPLMPTKFDAIHVTYCSNYNGCNITSAQMDNVTREVEYQFDDKCEPIVESIVDFAVVDCNEYGEFCGNMEQVEQFAIKAVKEVFGDDVTVTFENDDMST